MSPRPLRKVVLISLAAVLLLVLGLAAWHRHRAQAVAGSRLENASVGKNKKQTVADEYDLVYGTNHTWLTLKPSPFLVSTVAGLGAPPTGATALDIGSGNGRNALYLARRGYRVTGVDLSQVGLATTRQLARLYRLPVRTVDQDINAYPMGGQRWNLITLIDFPFAYRKLLPKIAAGLKPGGVVVVEDVSSKQGTMKSPDGTVNYTLMRRADLSAPFAGFHVLHDTEREHNTMWGAQAIMIRYAARKPAAKMETTP